MIIWKQKRIGEKVFQADKCIFKSTIKAPDLRSCYVFLVNFEPLSISFVVVFFVELGQVLI